MKIIAIIGSSGAGKDTAARILSEITHIPVLVSYTTRPMREGETNGKEHIFVNECTYTLVTGLAYTKYGNYEYWTSIKQLKEDNIYVIDEVGLKELRERFPNIDIVTIYVSASKRVRRLRGVTEERMERDDLREQFPLDYYDYRIFNNKTEEHLRETLRAVADTLNQHV